MPKPVKRRELVRRLRALGWEGPESGGSHEVMRRAGRKVSIPNPHGGDFDWSLVKRILGQAGISEDEWDRLA